MPGHKNLRHWSIWTSYVTLDAIGYSERRRSFWTPLVTVGHFERALVIWDLIGHLGPYWSFGTKRNQYVYRQSPAQKISTYNVINSGKRVTQSVSLQLAQPPHH